MVVVVAMVVVVVVDGGGGGGGVCLCMRRQYILHVLKNRANAFMYFDWK